MLILVEICDCFQAVVNIFFNIIHVLWMCEKWWANIFIMTVSNPMLWLQRRKVNEFTMLHFFLMEMITLSWLLIKFNVRCLQHLFCTLKTGKKLSFVYYTHLIALCMPLHLFRSNQFWVIPTWTSVFPVCQNTSIILFICSSLFCWSIICIIMEFEILCSISYTW